MRELRVPASIGAYLIPRRYLISAAGEKEPGDPLAPTIEEGRQVAGLRAVDHWEERGRQISCLLTQATETGTSVEVRMAWL